MNRWTEQAENRVKELTEQIKFYISEGINKETAIQMVKAETAIGKMYWEMVVENVN